MSLTGYNLIHPAPSTLSGTFTISAPKGSDTWRTPPSTDRSSSPYITQKVQVGSFRGAQITVRAAWKSMYDQGGLFLVLPPAPAAPTGPKPRWIKTGLEVTEGTRNASVVAANPYSDWSLLALDADAKKFADANNAEAGELTVAFERVLKDGKVTPAIWVYLVLPGGKRQNLREITWAFDGIEESEEVEIGVYAARPLGDESGEALEVEFKGWELKTA